MLAMRIVGKSVYRKEGLAKVLGQSIYTADMAVDDCLYGRTVRSKVPHGRIRAIRFQPGIPWHEFVTVLPQDIPAKNIVTLIEADQPFLAGDEVRHIAEPLALIAHENRELVEQALNYIEADIEDLPANFDMERALESGDIFKKYLLRSGDPDEVLRSAEVIVDETYRTGSQEHLYIEPQAMIARAVPGRGVTVWGSMQCPYYVRKAVAPLLGVTAESVRIVQMETGGGFGGKEEYPNMIAGHAALLSWKAGGRPVKMIYSRHEDMWATTKRHPSRTRIKAGFKRDGTLLALDIDLLLDGGAYATLSSVVLSRATLHSWGPYRCGHTRVRSHAVMTHSNPYGAFRGFGAPQGVFAIESHMNRAAAELRIDPAELRRRNLLRPGDRMPTGQVIHEQIDLPALMDRALVKSDFAAKRQRFEQENARSSARRKGIGLAVFFHGSGFTGSGEVRLASQAALRLTRHGHIEVLAANVEYGQGTNTTLSQIVAETCNVPADWVDVHQPDTQEVPDSGPTVASRTTMIVGRLIERGALNLKSRVMELGGLPDDYTPDDFKRAARQCFSEHGNLQVMVDYEQPANVTWDDETYQGEAYAGYSWSCDVAEVEVDPVDYVARVTNVTSIVECGRVINPDLAAGQIEGGIAQAVGFALYENVVLEHGAMQNAQYTNYIIPTAADVPEIDVEFIEFPLANPGPFGAKGIGEMPIDGPAPAIAAAVAQALSGRFVNQLPMLPERIAHASAAFPPSETRSPGVSRDVAHEVSPARGGNRHTINFLVNEKKYEIAVPPMKRLLDVLRDDVGLTGTKEGCGEGECGACTVIMNGMLVLACLVPICQVQGRHITTIEGLAEAGRLHPVQQAFHENGGAQCGICTPGMILAAVHYIEHPQECEDAAEALAGNQCRCTGFTRIFESLKKAWQPSLSSKS
jgi:CO/xanthine dehydrogenase Mo-binding subunit/aerobic-type carbon monoxide dehydrogenase small subunit (CoxS/CutS family)